jgi:hypothetical protein
LFCDVIEIGIIDVAAFRFFRLSSWGGVIDLGADYNSNLVKTEEAVGYLNLWKRFLLLAVE